MDLATFRSQVGENPPVLVLDTDVVASLSCGNLIPLLEQAWPDSCYVTNTVHDELKYLIAHGTVLCANYSLGRSWVQDSVEADDRLMDRTNEFRSRLAAPSDPPTKHVGEASTLALVEATPDTIAVFQERDARVLARAEGLPFSSLIEVMVGFAAERHTTCFELFTSHQTMMRNGRHVGYVASAKEFCVQGCVEHP